MSIDFILRFPIQDASDAKTVLAGPVTQKPRLSERGG